MITSSWACGSPTSIQWTAVKPFSLKIIPLVRANVDRAADDTDFGSPWRFVDEQARVENERVTQAVSQRPDGRCRSSYTWWIFAFRAKSSGRV